MFKKVGNGCRAGFERIANILPKSFKKCPLAVLWIADPPRILFRRSSYIQHFQMFHLHVWLGYTRLGIPQTHVNILPGPAVHLLDVQRSPAIFDTEVGDAAVRQET